MSRNNNLVLGLSEKNIELLKEGKPIKFNMKEMGFDDVNIVIFTGKDETAMQKTLMEILGIDPATAIIKDSRSGDN